MALCIFLIPNVHANRTIGHWKTYPLFNNTTHSEPAGEIIYVLNNGHLFSYDKEDTSIRFYDKTDLLSDSDIAAIAYNTTYKTLVIVYSNANIDLLISDKDTYNLSDFINKSTTSDTYINDIYFNNEFSYLSTSSGIIVLNLKKKEITNTYLNKHVYASAIEGSKLYAATREGLYMGLLTNNLLDPNHWIKLSSGQFSHITLFQTLLYANIPNEGIVTINKENHSISLQHKGNYTFMNQYNGKLLAGNKTQILLIHSNEQHNLISSTTPLLQHVSYANNTYWSSLGEKGLVGQKLNSVTGNLENIILPIIPESILSELPKTPKDTLTDHRGWIWYTTLGNPDHKDILAGFSCLNTNNTSGNTLDDQIKFIHSLPNQNGTIITISYCYCITEDKDGYIWIGTDKGPIILTNPTEIFNDYVYCTQIRVPRNDGTSNADFLLANEHITTISVDGANRKWIGTKNSGLYLFSPDGLETIHHFTQQNSPLLSNNVQSLYIHPNTGEVFIHTDKGVISYQSDATEANETFRKDAYAYPNPVHSDYDGLITVTGLIRDSDVKITDVSGHVIYSGTSLGGQFTWDGKNRQGRRVASGIYFVLAADAEGKEGIATKILMIK